MSICQCWGWGSVFFKKIVLDVINVCPLTDEFKTTCHLVLTHLKLNIQIVVSQFQIGTVPESHYLKSGKFCTWPSLNKFFLRNHRSCSLIRTYKVMALSIVIPFSHMFYLAFAASKNKRKQILRTILSSSVDCNLLNENVNCWI